jgi:hypothetical protein
VSDTRQACAGRGSAVTRNRLDEFAATLAKEAADREIHAALRACLESTCQRDRSAVQAVADKFKTDPSTVYRWANGELDCRPVRDFLDLVDTCVAAKGSENPAAYALPRLIRRRYLDPQAAPREITPELVTCTAAETMGAVGGLLKSLLDAVSPDSPGGTAPTPEEWADLEPQFEAVAELLEELRLARPTCMRRVPVMGEGVPS